MGNHINKNIQDVNIDEDSAFEIYFPRNYRNKYVLDKNKIIYNVLENDKINLPFTDGTDMKRLVHVQTIIPKQGVILQIAYDTENNKIKNKKKMRHELYKDNKWCEWYE